MTKKLLIVHIVKNGFVLIKKLNIMITAIIVLLCLFALCACLITGGDNYEIRDGGTFTSNPDDYYVEEISLPAGGKKYVPMAKLTTGRWVHIKEGPWAIGEYYDNYEDAKYVCDDCCNKVYLNS